MVRAETGIDERELFRLWIEHAGMTSGSFNRKELCRRMVRALFAERRVVRWTNARRNPDTPLLIEHRVVNAGLTFPNPLRSPIWRGSQHQSVRSDDRNCIRGVRIAGRNFYFRRFIS